LVSWIERVLNPGVCGNALELIVHRFPDADGSFRRLLRNELRKGEPARSNPRPQVCTGMHGRRSLQSTFSLLLGFPAPSTGDDGAGDELAGGFGLLSTSPDGPESGENAEAMTNRATTGTIPRVIKVQSERDRDLNAQVVRNLTHHEE